MEWIKSEERNGTGRNTQQDRGSGGNAGGYSDRGCLIGELSRAIQGDGTARVVYSDTGRLNGGLSRGSRDNGSRGRTDEAQGDVTSLGQSLSLFTSFVLKGGDVGLD